MVSLFALERTYGRTASGGGEIRGWMGDFGMDAGEYAVDEGDVGGDGWSEISLGFYGIWMRDVELTGFYAYLVV